jgi:type II secretory pathway pseudopilin PulG
MKTKRRFNRSRTIGRGAFTMVELMVVITIIIALMALAASAIFKYLATQQASNTQSTLDRVQSQLAKAWSNAVRQANSETIDPAIFSWIQTNLAGSDANATARVRVIYVKLKMRQQFPMNFAEALNVSYTNPELAGWGLPTTVSPSPLPALPGYVNYLNSLGITAAAVSAQSSPQPYESSACLLMALQRGVSGAGSNASDLTAGGAAGNYITPNNGSLPYLTDAWGRPIYFSRFPTGCPVLNPNGAQKGANDPGDPQGTLNSPAWQLVPASQKLFSMLALQQLAPGSSPPVSYKQAPMVASGGTDNWMKSGILTFDPITFAPGAFTLSTQTFVAGTTDSGVLYSKLP